MKKNKTTTIPSKILTLLKSGREENVSLAFALLEGQNIDVQAFVKSYEDIIQYLFLDKEPIEKAFANLFERTTYYQSNHVSQTHSYWDIDDRPFPDGFWKLSNLESIHLDEVKFTTIPPCIAEIKNLEKLKLIYCGIESLPDQFVQLPKLKELTITGYRIAKLPDDFGALQNLKELTIALGRITHLPDSFGALQNLEKLVLSGNMIQSLPKSFSELSNLQDLTIPNNKMNINFDLLRPLKKLKYLDFRYNNIPRVGRIRLRRELPDCKIIF